MSLDPFDSVLTVIREARAVRSIVESNGANLLDALVVREDAACEEAIRRIRRARATSCVADHLGRERLSGGRQ